MPPSSPKFRVQIVRRISILLDDVMISILYKMDINFCLFVQVL